MVVDRLLFLLVRHTASQDRDEWLRPHPLSDHLAVLAQLLLGRSLRLVQGHFFLLFHELAVCLLQITAIHQPVLAVQGDAARHALFQQLCCVLLASQIPIQWMVVEPSKTAKVINADALLALAIGDCLVI